MVVDSIKDFQKDLTKYLNSDEPVFVNDKKTTKTRGVFLPFKLYAQLIKEYKENILQDAIRTFDENPASNNFIDSVNKRLK